MPFQLMTHANKSPSMMQLLSAQKLFSSVFLADGLIHDNLQRHESHVAGSRLVRVAAAESSELVDLSCCLQGSQVTIPTLNG